MQNNLPPPQELLARGLAVEFATAIIMGQRGLDGAMTVLQKNKKLNSQEKAFTQHLLHLILKNKWRYDATLAGFLQKPIEQLPPIAAAILYAGMAQMQSMNVPDYAAVNSSVELAKHYNLGKLSGVINAVLKKVKTLAENSITYAPNWLQANLADYGAVAQEIWLASTSDVNYVDLSFKNAKIMQQYQNSQGWEHLLGNSLRVHDGGKITELAGYELGDWWVQDLGASRVIEACTYLLEGAQVADLCAAPGGKTMQLASAKAQVTAIDRSKNRNQMLQENLIRTKLKAEIITADLLNFSHTPYDFVALDAPCSATGTLRRNPDILYQLNAQKIAELTQLQAELLEVASKMVKPKGHLLYIVCSLFTQEAEQQIAQFLHNNPHFNRVALNLPPQLTNDLGEYRSLPHYYAQHGGMDGFFAALLQQN